MWLSHEACIQHSITCLCEHLCVCFLGRAHQSLGRSPERGFLSQLSQQSCQYAPSRLVRQTPTALRRLQYWLLLESFFPPWCFHCGFNLHMAADQWGWTPCPMMEQDWDLVQSVTWTWKTRVFPLFTCTGGRIWFKGSGRKCALTLPLTGSVISAKSRTFPRGRNYKMRVITANLSWGVDRMLYIKPMVVAASGCHHSLVRAKVNSLSCVRLFATPWFLAHRIFQARVLEWVAISFSRGSSWPRDQTRVPRASHCRCETQEVKQSWR